MSIPFSGLYIFGTSDGKFVKVGMTKGSLAARHRSLEQGQLTSRVELKLLAAVRCVYHRRAEGAFKVAWAAHRADVNGQETYNATPEVYEYINWLRTQPWTWVWEQDGPDDIREVEDFGPDHKRQTPLPRSDAMIADWDVREPMEQAEDLRGTPWSVLSISKPVYNDYYSPLWMIELARAAMGGIDLDPASHWVAARAQGISRYYSKEQNGLLQPWRRDGEPPVRVWLNAPYGENKGWAECIVRHWDAGDIAQLCWLAPAYAFNKQITKGVIARASEAVLLTVPTDRMFWGFGHVTTDISFRGRRSKPVQVPAHDPSLGVNQPHLIVYLGDRGDALVRAFADDGKGVGVRFIK